MTRFFTVSRPLLGIALMAAALAATPALAQGGPPEGRGGGPPAHAGPPDRAGGGPPPDRTGGGPPPHAGGNDADDRGGGPRFVETDDRPDWDDPEQVTRTIGGIIREILGYDPLALEPTSGGGLPPGLANRESLPPGIARQVRETGSLSPGLQRQLEGRIGERTGYEVDIIRDTIRLIDPVTGNVAQVLDGILAFQRLLDGLN